MKILPAFHKISKVAFFSNIMLFSKANQGSIWDRFADGYSKKPIADPEAYERKLKTTQTYFNKDMNVVELGCGTGGTSIIHAPHVNHILATDISRKMIDIAKERALDAGVKNVDFEVSSAEALSIDSGSKDAVLGLSLLHLLPDRQTVYQQVHRWLKPQGLFVTSTVCMGEMGGIPRVMIGIVLPVGAGLGLLPSVQVMKHKQLRNEMKEAGFSIVHEWQPEKNKPVLFMICRKI